MLASVGAARPPFSLLARSGPVLFTGYDEVTGEAAVEYVVKGLASGALKPVIDRTFKFDDMVEVHRYLENSGQFGKIVVTL